ncbi:MAG TPA: hypothetical protein VI732_00430 [Alphaproteobacteria bacterium]|nr:hypothetical protein [Alphaproteobacteria bacterium]
MRWIRRGLWYAMLLPVFALGTSGCVPADLTMIDPPSLNLQSDPPPPRVTNIKIENGEGETLYNGPRPGDGRIAANPAPQQLDGTLKVTRSYSDGSVKDQTLTFDAGKPVKIEYSDAEDRYYVDKSAPAPVLPRFYAGVMGNYEFRNRPDTPLIRKESGGAVTGFVNGDNDSSNPGFKLRTGFTLDNPFLGLGKKWGAELNGRYYTSTAKDNIDAIPAAGGNLAFFGPLGGGGATTGNDLRNLSYRSRYWSWGIEPRLRKGYDLGSFHGSPVTMDSYLGFEYGEDEDDEDLDFDIPAIGSHVTSRVMLDNRYYGPTFGFDGTYPIYGQLFLAAGAFGNLFVNNLSASRSIDLSNTAFRGSDSLSQTTVTLGGGANIGLNYEFAPNIKGRVGYEYEYANNTPFLDVDQAHGGVSVKTRGADVHRLFLGVRVQLP